MDKKILQNQIQGLEAKIVELRANERLFIKAQGIDEAAAKSQKEIADHEIETQAIKEDIAEKKAKKSAALKPTAKALAAAMGETLPKGEAVLNIEDGKVFLGWKIEGNVTPYNGLSGGEKMAFDPSLGNALLGDCEKLTIVEAAELDSENLMYALAQIKANGKGQFIVNTCHAPLAVQMPEGWNVVAL